MVIEDEIDFTEASEMSHKVRSYVESSFEHELPGEGDRLFVDRPIERGNMLNFWPYEVHGNHCRGYCDAARLVGSQILLGPYQSDHMVMPLAFLYHHALELSLKCGIYEAERANGRTAREAFDLVYGEESKYGHSLKKLWQKYRCVMFRFSEHQPDYKMRMNAAEKLIEEFDGFGKSGFLFRYQRDRKAAKSYLLEEQTEEAPYRRPNATMMNVRVFVSSAEKLLNLISGLQDDIPDAL
ncbi:hypothetical protein AKJ29_15390 [Aliiroseovarius crassostreae]|uniref:Uncharacterized protein n=1 Tax=Aliiroseovarius crassostreae TaxID=154981 RepID=A0A0P7I465_9RHOB|nr:hypothetical protein [Aliiroseovarius crassostreae]KPN64044.1 hypothetical protein AKJ29_15390 [Aliiroseovarius crassostreae]